MRIALAQINPTVGDLEGNSAIILDRARRAVEAGAALVVFPELALCGYPPRDLVEMPLFLDRSEQALERLARQTADLPVETIVGYVGRASRENGHRAANSAALLSGGRVVFVQEKMLLPCYDVFDEWRHYCPAERQTVRSIAGRRVGLTICEDVWNDQTFWERPRYERDPVAELAAQGVDCVVNIAASPYHMGKRRFRECMLRTTARRLGAPIVMVNQVGGNDQLIFDGSSFALDADGRVVARGRSFDEDFFVVDLDDLGPEAPAPPENETAAAYDALVVGVRDYFRKCGFTRAVIGLSGGIDSSIVAALAVEALGADNVIGVGMPGPYSSEGSVRDARALAENLGIRFESLPINGAYRAMIDALAPVFEDRAADETEENIQARLRGVTLMAIANKLGALTLATGNKSEIAVGYCTLYGDMAGGLAVISDVPKTLVYEISREANRRRPGAIPEAVFTKPPSAELRPDQKDTDSLPDYETLDPMLRLYIEERRSPEEIAEATGATVELARKIVRMVDRSEYKRQQAAPGLRVTSKAFGVGRRLPIAQRFRP